VLVGAIEIGAAVLGDFERCGRNGGDELAAVVVDAEKIERGAAEFHVAGFDAHEVERIVTRKSFRIFAVESWMNKPNVAERVGAIGVALGGGLAVGHAEGRANLKF
jgi:hypothetical protein